VLGGMDLVTGILLIVAPAMTLTLMGIEGLPADAVFLRWIGVFVGAVGSFYFYPLLIRPRSARASAMRTVWALTAAVRLAVGLFTLISIAVGALAAVFLDGGLALVDVPVDLIGDGLGGKRPTLGGKVGQSHPNLFELSNRAVLGQIDGQLKSAVGSLLSADLDHTSGLLDDLAKHFAFVDGEGHRLFSVEVLACFACGHRHGRVPMIGRAVYDHVDVVAFEQLAIVAIDVRFAVESLLGPVGVSAIEVADCYHVAEFGRVADIAQTASTHANGPDQGPIVFGSRLAGLGVMAGKVIGSNHRGGRGGSGGPDKFSTVGGWFWHVRGPYAKDYAGRRLRCVI
jgi:hypothetical protein